MVVWTEILTESVGVTHVGTMQVAFPIGDVEYEDVRKTVEYLAARDQFREEMEKVEEQIEQHEHARQRLEDAGYDPSEIPL